MVSAGYSGMVDLGGGPLSSTDNTLVAVFDASGNLKMDKTVTVTAPGILRANVGTCGMAIATNSPTVDSARGPYRPRRLRTRRPSVSPPSGT